ncbi:MAG TPA: TolC family protein [Gemmataceae bacterium]|nr:TolC family protein [Gemmataceae bacterium]
MGKDAATSDSGPQCGRSVALLLLAVCGCCPAVRQVADNVILPEQRTIAYQDPAPLSPVPIPPIPPPRTVSQPRTDTPNWPMSLDEAIRIALENAHVVRTLAGLTAVPSGQTIYDTAIVNTTIDQQQARFDPVLNQSNTWTRTNVPFGALDPFNPFESIITSTPTDSYLSQLNLTKTNVLGGQWAVNWTENPTRVKADGLPLNPDNPTLVSIGYTQPLLQGAGFAVNMAPIVIARLNTDRSYFQYKDSVQELVRGVVEAYWNLVQGRINVWAVQIQVEQSEYAYKLAKARHAAGLGSQADEALALVTYSQFKATLVASQATVLSQEGALRNLLGLPPEDGRRIVPTTPPTSQRLTPDWDKIIHLAEQRRPDIVELKLIVEADKQQLLVAENQALPALNATALYRWNGLSGEAPNGQILSTGAVQYPDWSVGVTFSVPLGLRQGRAAVRQNRLIIARDLENVAQGVHGALADLAAAVRDLDSAYEQYLALKETREAAYVNLQVQAAQYKTGRVEYLNLLTAIQDWGNAVSSEAQQLLAYNVALAALERQTGTILETHGLVFNEERFRAAGPIPCHDRDYPSALVPVGQLQRYPVGDKPSEDAFDLKKPDTHTPLPDVVLPPPDTVLPAPRKQP